MLVRHKVKDFPKWKKVFDEHTAFREENGSKGGYLFRNIDNSDETIIIFKWNYLEDARQFASSENLKDIMERAGVADKPDIYFLNEVEKVSA